MQSVNIEALPQGLGTNLGYAQEAYTLAGLDIEADARSANASGRR